MTFFSLSLCEKKYKKFLSAHFPLSTNFLVLLKLPILDASNCVYLFILNTKTKKKRKRYQKNLCY